MHTLLIIINLILLESMLSIDNAAVLAVMVRELPENQQKKALRYGLLGAYVFRGACLFAVGILISIFWLKVVGGLYLLYLCYGHFSKRVTTIEEGATEEAPTWATKMKTFFENKIGKLWSVILLVEVMDLIFSIDNIFAATALSSEFWVVVTGVAIGMLAMRVVAGWFILLIKRFPSLESSAFVVIGLLGLKLIASGAISGIAMYTDYLFGLDKVMYKTDVWFSVAMMIVFFAPILIKRKTYEP